MTKKGPNLHVVLLHEQMVDKQGLLVTTSLTLIDVHDIARSARTFGVKSLFIAHPSQSLRQLTHVLHHHWDQGFGATYNPNRKEALEIVNVVASLDEAIMQLEMKFGSLPKLVATSARPGKNRLAFADLRDSLEATDTHYLLMLGTGWGMSEMLLKRADLFLEPIPGRSDYNHLSVRSACAIILDRLVGIEA